VLNAICTDQRICLENGIKYGLAFSWLRGEREECGETITQIKTVKVEEEE